ncbi:MAG: type II secretion system protein J [Fluviibacter sp.]|jgi:type IV pilus assembly protein PilW
MSQRLAGSKRLRPHRNEAGISLLETLIAMALGLLVLAGVLQLTNQLVAGNTAMIQVTRLEQDTRTVIDIIVQDLRRAGHFPEAGSELGDMHRFLQNQPTAPLIDGEAMRTGKAGASIAYAYRETDGKLIQARFAHDAKAGTVQMHTGSASAPETITDPAFMVVAALSFQPTLAVANAGSMSVEQTTVEVRIVTRLKSDPTVERQLVDQVVLRNPLLRNSAQP